MALYSLSVKNFSRGKAHAVIAAAAYRSGERLYDRYNGKIHDFTQKRGIVYRQLLLPPTAPREYSYRETLWNEAEKAEKRGNSRLAKEVRVALPNELTLEDNVRIVDRYVTDNFISIGMCADVAIHDKGDGNPHAHILLTTRSVTPEGFNGNKDRSWDTKSVLVQWRREWANCLNREYERQGLGFRVDHKSYKERGIDREPHHTPRSPGLGVRAEGNTDRPWGRISRYRGEK
jgi:hypothetical protein